ncbi:hypothetical protein STEG23_013890 [Scotinomys teguina]
MYPDLAELEDSDISDDGSEYTEGVQSIIEQLESTNIQGPAGSRVGAGTPGEMNSQDQKAEDVASMDDFGSEEPAVVDDIGPAVPSNGDHA